MKQVDYFERVMSLDLASDLTELFELRRSLLSGKFEANNGKGNADCEQTAGKSDTPKSHAKISIDRGGSANDDPRNARIEYLRQIERMYEDFWITDPDQLANKCEELDPSRYPDLARRLERLQFLNTQRDALSPSEAAMRGKFDFFNEIARLFLMKPEEAQEHKEWLTYIVSDLSMPREVLSGLREIKKNHPRLYALEEEYLNSLEPMLVAHASLSIASEQEPERRKPMSEAEEWSYTLVSSAFRLFLVALTVSAFAINYYLD